PPAGLDLPPSPVSFAFSYLHPRFADSPGASDLSPRYAGSCPFSYLHPRFADSPGASDLSPAMRARVDSRIFPPVRRLTGLAICRPMRALAPAACDRVHLRSGRLQGCDALAIRLLSCTSTQNSELTPHPSPCVVAALRLKLPAPEFHHRNAARKGGHQNVRDFQAGHVDRHGCSARIRGC